MPLLDDIYIFKFRKEVLTVRSMSESIKKCRLAWYLQQRVGERVELRVRNDLAQTHVPLTSCSRWEAQEENPEKPFPTSS